MPRAATDRNLLFGILSLQMDFIHKDQLIAAMQAWVFDKDKSLGQILLEQNALDAGTHELLESLVRRHLDFHDNDPEKSLAAIAPLGSAQDELRDIGDSDLQASLALVSVARFVQDGRYPSSGPAPSIDGDPNLTRDQSTVDHPASHPRFRVLRLHARGGLGEVFAARDEELNREVALKEMKEKYAANPERRARFLLEAQITGNLEHPGIVPVYGVGEYADGRPFYAMRFIRGETLKEAVDRFHKADSSSGWRKWRRHASSSPRF